ncbi:MAG TPA: DUF3416 domain-containing protein [bacterium (Candidatus Stahlbacteria)]|nr:DUF3416 domain-containing protein [Candidatus Stahlbacteria bacterium]
MDRNLKIIIRNVYPELDGGRYPVKSEIDRVFDVYADVLSEEPVKVWLKYRPKEEGSEWKKVPMQPIGNNRWKGSFTFDKIGRYQYTIEADAMGTKATYARIPEVIVDPVKARFAAWYEMFARSQGKVEGRSATFKDMEDRLTDIKGMGFDIIYLTPIHPIGRTNRKGPNNSLVAGPNDPGSPWAVGNELGGHKSIDPAYGTIEDFRHFVATAKAMGMDVSMDITLNCSPDHPYVKEHPGWFYYNPDGTLKYAENPPKKYEDTCPLNFYPDDREAMWEEMKSIFTYWIEQGIKFFRVDNPHTKPIEFWEWLINEIKERYPDVVLLAEAFTEPARLEALSKIGFSQSYTYFTWRNYKDEIIEYFSELTGTIRKEYLRGNLFTNTPDILPKILQVGSRPAFKMRVALAATLSPLYGIYNGYELCENDALPGTEEYRNSEKYQYKVWDWERPGNIKSYIAKLNRIRKENTALQYYDNLRFYDSTDEHILFYGKISPDNSNVILVAVNLDPFNTHQSRVTVPVDELGIASDDKYKLRELITDTVYTWRGKENCVRLDPNTEPVQIFRLEQTP